MVEVIDALSQLQSAVPGAHGQEFVRISKRGEVDIVISTIDPDDLQALPAVDVREYVDAPKYSGPTKKGIRFNWEKLPEVIALLRIQATRLGAGHDVQPRLFPDAKPKWVEQAAAVADATAAPANRNVILADALPEGAKRFPVEFLDGGQSTTAAVELPSEPVEVAQLRDGKWAVRSSLGLLSGRRQVARRNGA
ncbi:MAG: hypothetical protein ACLP9L_20900 [Thermoguttaceae bacterium]